jgi:MFS family permease
MPHDAYVALRSRDYRLYLSGNVIANLGMQMQTAAIGWEVYARTGSAWMLGWVGLAQVLPVIALVLPAGHVADRFNRRRVVMTMQVLIASCSLGLAWVSHTQADVRWIYVLLLIIGTGKAFLQPARAALVTQLVPREAFSNAVTWHSGGFHLACIVGPALGGWLIAMLGGAMLVYVLDATGTMTFFTLLAMMQPHPTVRLQEAADWRSLGAGFAFLRGAPVVFGSITLDMFAVLLGGATTLLPIYARDILHVGAAGYGWLRAAPALGALLMAFILAHRPPIERAGRALLWSVAGFGLATIVFGWSRCYPLSIVMLFLTGMLDNVSVVIRHTLVQLLTPDEMRGRVSAINSMFIGASNELGGFESGAVAAIFTPVFSVVSGGIGTLAVVAVIALVYPQLRRYGRLGSTPTPS